MKAKQVIIMSIISGVSVWFITRHFERAEHEQALFDDRARRYQRNTMLHHVNSSQFVRHAPWWLF